MDKSLNYLAVKFLVNEAIKIRDNKEYNNKRLWDAIWKAHLDTLTGARTNNLKNYCGANCQGKTKTTKMLYDEIVRKDQEGERLNSNDLITYLKENDENKGNKEKEIEFGAIQKLVNMTLKYIIILNMFGELKIEVNEEKCDCPIDSYILKALYDDTKSKEITSITWTKIKDKKDYDDLQTKISSELAKLKKDNPNITGNIWYDFIKWKKITKSEENK